MNVIVCLKQGSMHTVRWSKGNRRGDPAHEVRWRREMREAERESENMRGEGP